MNLEILDQKINDIQWKVQSYSKNKPSCSFVAYIDARQAMDLLDKACGKGNWQDKYELVNGTLFCHLGVKIDGEWIWKTDCGTESNVEKEKGEVSDAFKRAAVKWGVGRFLYELPIQWLTTNAIKDDKENKYPYPIDEKNNRIKDVSKYINDKLKISEVRKVTESEVTPPEKTPAPLPLTTENNDVVGQKKVKNPVVPFDFNVFEKALSYISTEELISLEAEKALFEYDLTESEIEKLNEMVYLALIELDKKIKFKDVNTGKEITQVKLKLNIIKSFDSLINDSNRSGDTRLKDLDEKLAKYIDTYSIPKNTRWLQSFYIDAKQKISAF